MIPKRLRREEDEPLHKWCERLNKAIKAIANMSSEQRLELFRELSVVSYIEGSNAAIENVKKYGFYR